MPITLEKTEGIPEELRENIESCVDLLFGAFEERFEQFNLETTELQQRAIVDDASLQQLTQKRMHFLQGFRRAAAMLVGEMNVRLLTMMPPETHEKLKEAMAEEMKVSLEAGERDANENAEAQRVARQLKDIH